MIEILDIEEESHYDGFPLLPLEQRDSVPVGGLVELLVHDGKRGETHRGELLWFKVVWKDSEGYSGQLVEEPKKLEHTKKGAYLRFEPRHIVGIVRV